MDFILPAVIAVTILVTALVSGSTRRFFAVSAVAGVLLAALGSAGGFSPSGSGIKEAGLSFALYFSFAVMAASMYYPALALCNKGRQFLPVICMAQMAIINLLFLSSSAVERLSGSAGARDLLIDASLRFNPAILNAAAVQKLDVLRQGMMYSYFSPVGGFYPYSYPGASSVVFSYVFISLIFFQIGAIISKVYCNNI